MGRKKKYLKLASDEDSNIIQKLLERNLTEICFAIFEELDPESFVNCQMVCKEWYHFIRTEFYNRVKGREHLKFELQQIIFDVERDTWTDWPDPLSVTMKYPIISMSIDKNGIALLMLNELKHSEDEDNGPEPVGKTAHLAYLNFHSLNTIWESQNWMIFHHSVVWQ